MTRPDPDWLKTLLTKQDVRLHIYHCSGRLHRLADVTRSEELGAAADAISDLKAEPKNDSTQLGAAVRQVLAEYNAASLAAVVVLTDGVTTEGESLDHASDFAKDQGVPLFFVGVGDANDVRNLRLHDLQAVDSVYVNDRILFELTLTGVGYPGLTVPVTLKEKGKDAVLDKKEVTLPAGNDDVKVQLEYKPTEPGERTFVIETPLPARRGRQGGQPPRAQGLRPRGQAHQGAVRRGLPALRVPLPQDAAGARERPDPGQQEHRPQGGAAERRPGASRPRTAPPWRRSRRKEELKAYDVIILGDVDPRPKDDNKMTEHLKDIAEWVTEHGGGLLMIAGERYAPFYYKDSPLKDVLPVDVVADRPPDERQRRADGGLQAGPDAGGPAPPDLPLRGGRAEERGDVGPSQGHVLVVGRGACRSGRPRCWPTTPRPRGRPDGNGTATGRRSARRWW